MRHVLPLGLLLIAGAELGTAQLNFNLKWAPSSIKLPKITYPSWNGKPRWEPGPNDPKPGDPCTVQYEENKYEGKCQREDVGPYGSCPEHVSLYGCGAKRGDGNPMRCCVQVPCAEPYQKLFCKNIYKRGVLFPFHIDPNLCPFGEDILCYSYDLAEGGRPYVQAAAGGLEPVAQDPIPQFEQIPPPLLSPISDSSLQADIYPQLAGDPAIIYQPAAPLSYNHPLDYQPI